ncbi:toxin [Pedobacter nototheniae]|uniref:toxin n=1 Tax=Pedobacter nototheniae TaxID=2488994 RepID=UPI00103ACF92|nr:MULTISPECIES: toxin [Pedobacter]
MPQKPKLRIFAGPNGSGKTTLFDSIKSSYFSTRIFVNADLLEEDFNKKNFLNLSDFDIESSKADFESFCFNNGLFLKAGFNIRTWNLVVKENVVVKGSSKSNHYNSYHFAILADFIRYKLIESNKSFSFETVFSHPAKLELIDFAHQNNYKVYLYFIGTETPFMNLERVKDRVEKGGHLVEGTKIEKRYFLTMDLLIDMLKRVDETYLWDNSGIKHQFVGSIKKGILELEFLKVPTWLDTYVLSKIK